MLSLLNLKGKALLGIVAGLIFVMFSTGQASAATYTVSNTNNSGAGSLRQAITDANGGSGSDTINFSIGSGAAHIIPTSPMPAIINPVVIDGTSQPGYSGAPLIELSGNGAGSNAIGLRVTGNGSGSTIRGLIINRFSSNGIFLDSSNNTVAGNYIGTTADGSGEAGNIGDGVGIFSGIAIAQANNNTIGGTSTADRNVISGNGTANPAGANGVVITAQGGGAANNNIVSGNYIGTNAAGNAAIANNADGVLINDGGSGTLTGNTIGGTTGVTVGGACTGACNLLSGNRANGAGLWHVGAHHNNVKGNYIGTNAAGTAAVANKDIGFESQESPDNTIGGTTAAERNIISGNLGAGIFLDGDAATGNVMQGNYIGTNAAGTAAIPNVKMGIGIGYTTGILPAHHQVIGGTTGTTPGGACTGACNLISGNGQNGILMEGPGSNIIHGNYIGTNSAGTGNIKNTLDGIGIVNTSNNAIGNGTANGRNVISANGDNGIIITGGGGNRIEGNYLGKASDGGSLGNAGAGIMMAGGNDTAILGNGIGYNVKLGIDLGYNNVSANDTNDGDGGPNRTQNFPNLFGAITKDISGTPATKIGGHFNSTPNGAYRLEFFSSSSCNAGVPFNYGEGHDYIGASDVTTDQFGNTAFGFTPSSTVAGQQYITATATKKISGTPAETSEFSQCILVNSAKPALTNGATWFLKYDLTTGPGDKTFGYGFPSHFLMCAWDADQLGVKLPVIFSGGTWFMLASYTTGAADRTFSYGSGDSKPVCGDWDGDGIDTIGVVSSNNTWNLRNSNNAGSADAGSFQYGGTPSKPVVGDWDGDGDDTVGVVNTSNGWDLRNTNSAGSADASFSYGFTPSYPIVGDWDGNGTDTIGSVSTGGTWALRNSNSGGASNSTFQFGFPGAVPIIW